MFRFHLREMCCVSDFFMKKKIILIRLPKSSCNNVQSNHVKCVLYEWFCWLLFEKFRPLIITTGVSQVTARWCKPTMGRKKFITFHYRRKWTKKTPNYPIMRIFISLNLFFPRTIIISFSVYFRNVYFCDAQKANTVESIRYHQLFCPLPVSNGSRKKKWRKNFYTFN